MTLQMMLLGVVGIGLVALVAARPAWVVLATGVFLFVQSAVIRLDAMPIAVANLFARADEVVLLLLALRTTVVVARDFSAARARIPSALIALAVFAGIAAVSAIANSVDPIAAGVGLYLSIKAGLWLLVARFLDISRRTVVVYGYLVGGLFVGSVAVAVLQLFGVVMPWQPSVRPISGEFAATSIWSQHTVFGSSVAVAVGLAVFAIRLPGERLMGWCMAAIAGTGVLLSSVRRLLLSLPLAAAVTGVMLSVHLGRGRSSRPSWLRRQPWPVLVLALITAVVIVLAPRIYALAQNAWIEYVVNAADRDRYKLYGGAWELFSRSPLVGRGPGTFGSYPSVLFGSPAYGEVGLHIKASLRMGAPYASLVAEFGLLGTAAFGAFVVLLVRALLGPARAASAVVGRALASAAIFMIVDMLVESVVHPTFRDSFISFFVFTAAGAALALGGQGQEAETAWNPAAVSNRVRIAAVLAGVAIIGLTAGVLALLPLRG